VGVLVGGGSFLSSSSLSECWELVGGVGALKVYVVKRDLSRKADAGFLSVVGVCEMGVHREIYLP
jgi:hypothetical protein